MTLPWMYPYPPPDPEPRPLRAADLSRELLDAIERRDHDKARRVFDRAFWDKIDFKPDAYHLLQAARQGDRKLVSMLASYGAHWTDEEAALAKRLITPDRWQAIEGPLKNAGIRTVFDAAALLSPGIMPSIRFAHRAATEAQERGLPGAVTATRELHKIVSTSFTAAVLANDQMQAREILRYRDAKLGNGITSLLDVAQETEQLVRDGRLSAHLALRFLDRLQGMNLGVKPLEVSMLMMFLAPEIVQELDKRKLLAENQPVARRDVLDNWTGLQESIPFAGGQTLQISPASVSRRRNQFNEMAKVLFKKPLSEREADYFVRLHETRSGMTPDGLKDAEEKLLGLGFFDAPAFNAERMRRLAAIIPLQDEKLSKAFNSRALRLTIRDMGAEKLINDKKFPLLLEAHALGAYKATAAETARIVKYLAGKTQKDVVTPETVAALATLKDAGADFSAIDPMQYLGRRAPGLAKVLLDLDIVTPEHFDVTAVSRKMGGTLNLFLKNADKAYAYTEFTCQLILEITAPETYKPRRGAHTENYQTQFIAEWARNLSKRPSTFTYKRRGPKAGGG
ncbi:MAG: hypothetical protein PW788_02175 [Micavibrio sp.]|nr:hypothetical protein [Micavibrio sp.]